MVIVCSLCNGCIHKFVLDLRRIEQIINGLTESGIYVLVHRTAGPVGIHIRAFA